ncbi:hypothetical protein C8R46DRAFT_1356064 [Mycena filopes]|nr:hypothetical protein C8R46DRAFT_1356064 [Mycena filopes]
MKALPVLPVEVVGEIFLAFHDLYPQESPHSMLALLKVSQISGRWRAIAHHTTALWTHIALEFHTRRQYHRLREQISRWVARSHPRPLTVTIRSCYPDPQNPIIDFVLAHASRIHSLCLTLPQHHFHPLLLSPGGVFILLDTLTLSTMAKVETVFDPAFGVSRSEFFSDAAYYGKGGEVDGILWKSAGPQFSVFGNLPRLRNVTIDSDDINDLDIHMFPISWANLTHINLTLVTLGVHDTAYLLPLCVRAEVLCFSTSSDDRAPSIPSFTLPLVSLEWVGFNADALSVFEPLAVPHLTSLYLRDACEETLRSLQTRSSFALQRLSLCFVYLTLPYLLSLLRGMPSLTILELYLCIDISDALLAFLAYTETAPVLPSLTKFVICAGDQQSTFDERAMLRMVASRWRATPFTQIRIATARPAPCPRPTAADVAHSRVLARIAELRLEGLEFEYEVKYRPPVSAVDSGDDYPSGDDHSDDDALEDDSE